jgi:tetratricopeptide (TPR) repeat protein
VIELLAYHYGRSGDDARAVDYAIRSGEKAQTRWANTEALAHFDAALKRLASMEDDSANRLRRIDAIVKQAEIKFALGKHAEHVQALESIRALADESADAPRRAAWYYWAGFLHSLTGARPEVSLPYCLKALEIADTAGLDDLRAFAECALAHVYYYAGDLGNAFAAGERALAMFEERGNVWWACRALFALSPAANATGEWARGLAYCRKILEYGQKTNDLRLKVTGWWRMGETHIRQGNAAEGLRCCDEAQALSPIPFDAAMIKAARGLGLLRTGDPTAATAQLTEAVAWFEQSHLRYTRAWFSLRLAEAHLVQGERARARAIAAGSLETARECGARYVEAVAARTLAEALIDEDPDTAAGHLEVATSILEEIGARPELARALAAHAALCEARSDVAGARELLDRSQAVARACGMRDDPRRLRAAPGDHPPSS